MGRKHEDFDPNRYKICCPNELGKRPACYGKIGEKKRDGTFNEEECLKCNWTKYCIEVSRAWDEV